MHSTVSAGKIFASFGIVFQPGSFDRVQLGCCEAGHSFPGVFCSPVPEQSVCSLIPHFLPKRFHNAGEAKQISQLCISLKNFQNASSVYYMIYNA